MTKKQMLDNSNDMHFTHVISVRLEDSDYQFLVEKAHEMRCTLGQALRYLIFKKTGDLSGKMTASEARRRQVTALKNMRNEFKHLVSHYKKFVDLYTYSTQEKDRLGNPSVNTDETMRAVNSLTKMTVELQNSLNRLLREMKEQEMHIVSMTTIETDKMKDKESNDKQSNLYNMERIQIIGFLEDAATEYEGSLKGVKKMRFSVSCDRKTKSGSKKVIYRVFASKTDIMDRLTKGSQVFVEGTFTEGDKGEKLVFADAIKLCYQE